MPDESDPAAWKAFKENPERKFLDVVNTRVSTAPGGALSGILERAGSMNTDILARIKQCRAHGNLQPLLLTTKYICSFVLKL